MKQAKHKYQGFTDGSWHINGFGQEIIICDPVRGRSLVLDVEEKRANARLVSLVPEMFEILKLASGGADISAQARDIIAKAEGTT